MVYWVTGNIALCVPAMVQVSSGMFAEDVLFRFFGAVRGASPQGSSPFASDGWQLVQISSRLCCGYATSAISLFIV